MRRVVTLVFAACLTAPAVADDNAVAHRLFEQERYGEAAEIFTDPAWKGAAFYRSDQLWRAAEAFVRAEDVASIYNLGNCYARLGYYELALEAYLNALAREPDFADAAANADIMRRAIADRKGGQSGIQPQARQIDETEQTPDPTGKGGKSGDERGAAQEQRPDTEADRQKPAGDPTKAQSQPGQGGSGEGKRRESDQAASAERVEGTAGTRDPAAENAPGGSAGTGAGRSDEAAGLRMQLEAEQAIEQWLNRISDRPERFLKARIALEARRRAAAGSSPADGDEAW